MLEVFFYVSLGVASIYISVQSSKQHPQKVQEFLKSKGYKEITTKAERGLFKQGFCRNDRINFTAIKDNKKHSGYICANSWFKTIH